MEVTDGPAWPLVLPAPGPAPSPDPATSYVASLVSPRSRTTVAGRLRTVSRLLCGAPIDPARVPWHLLHAGHTAALRTLLTERYAPANVRNHLSALRGVLRYAWRLGLMSTDDWMRASDIPPVRGRSLPAGRALSPTELRMVFATCIGTKGARDAAALGIMFGCGLRRRELVGLDLDDHDTERQRLAVRQAKGGAQRTVPIPAGTTAALSDWTQLRGPEPGPLLHPVTRSGRILPRRLAHDSVRAMCITRAELAGIKRFTPHDLRRTYVTMVLDEGADLLTAARMAGHQSVETTMRYDRRGEEHERRAADRLTVPYIRQLPLPGDGEEPPRLLELMPERRILVTDDAPPAEEADPHRPEP